ncbi:tetratricopeptide repeat protein [Psychromonas algicola]|uniref:tetratricopeptide repeat protein n=1 Tax=Psychromonas algicola TaxID=2555642 RepID=UPI0010686ABA|nr:sel1 repeat family protein [Psychromonas sp. RZ5]TEW52918.1 sel1 repeat family protein [Psychromonas sp. RZ5]
MKILMVMCLLFSNLSWASDNDVNHDIKSDVGISNQINNDLIDRAVRLVNQRKSYKAVEILQSDVFKEDANAQFWLGVARYHSGEHFIAGDAFLKSAELGDPWAMAVLGGGGDNIIYLASPCEYLGWGCDKKWNAKAIKIWKRLAKQGDPDALYAYTLMKDEWFEFVPFYGYRRFLERVEQAIPNGGGYEFLTHFSWDYDDKVKYARMAIEQGYAPAMNLMPWPEGEGGADQWANKAARLGYYRVADNLYYIYHDKSDHSDTKSEAIELIKKAYFYSVVSVSLGGRGGIKQFMFSRILKDEAGNDVRDENGYFVDEILITKAEQAEIEQQAKDFLKGVEINLFLTKNSSELFTF